jgi:transcriptional regulator with XRE-family HTH domain
MSRMSKAANGTDLGVHIGRNIKLARAQQGLTQGELAEALGVETVTMSRIETGAQQPSISRLQQIAGVLGTSLAALVADAGEDSDRLVLLAEALKGLPPREQDFVRDFVVSYSLHWKAGQPQ